jgi:formate dehydrogenase subunit delta
MSSDKLAYMANQIGRFFAAQKKDDAVAAIADHLMKFWDPRMRKSLLSRLDDAELDPLPREAVERIRAETIPPPTDLPPRSP